MNYDDLETLCDDPNLFTVSDAADDGDQLPVEADLLNWCKENGISAFDLNYTENIPQSLPPHAALYYYNEGDWPCTVLFNDKDDAVLFRLSV